MSSNLLDSVVLQKEKEWKEAFQLRVRALEESVVLKEKELKQEKLRFLKLKEDFEYNLKLLIERDEELEKYDAVIGKIKQAEHVKTAEVSELYVKIDELKMNLENEQKAKEELQKHYQKRLQEYQNELKNFRELKDNEVAKEREELSSFRRNLESQLREAEDNFEFCRQELVSNFDQVMKKREQEYRAKLDETSGLLLSNELKVRSLRKELELLRSDSGRCKDELTKTELSTRELEKLVKEKDWMIADLENTHQYKITDLKMQVENMKKTGDKLQEDFQRKHAQLDRVVREREEMLANAKQGFAEEERQLQKKIRELHGQLETKDEEYRQKEWRFVDMKKENDVTVHKLQQTISEMKDKLDKESEEYARCTVAKDIEVEALHEQEAKLRSELAQRKEDLERRQKELAMSLEREASLERSRVQLELDWQRRCEEAERTGYERQEELVRNLTQGKEEALSLVKQQKRELQHKDSVIRILTTQRDESLATLKRHGLPAPPQIPHKDVAQTVENTADLQVQNENLLQIIHQMREDMEDLTKQLSKRTAGSAANTESGVPITEEFVASLEKEIREVKAKNRELTQSLANTERNIAEANQVVDKNDPRVRSLVTQLNETIGSLRQEKLDLTSQVRKYEATVMHLQTLLHQSSTEIRQRQVNIDQLEYQLSREHRRSEEEMNALKKQNSDLSLQVTQARYEADEFYKTGLERNIDAVALGNQLSTLKLDLVSQGKMVNSRNPQSRYVQDLQDEIQRLRKQLEDHHSGKKTRMQSSETTLHAKLREAAHRINELTKEREKLIKMGNKLRAELLKYKDTASSTSDNTSSLPAGHVNVPSRSNLRGLEQLQYELTSRELQYAQQTLTKHTEQIAAQEPSLSNKPAEATGLQVSTKIPDDVISPWQPSFSSDDRSSLQEVWKLLDEDSPGFTSREIHEVRGGHARERSSTPDSLTVKGEPSQVQVKPESTKPALSAKAAGKWKPAPPPKAKIRNYNMRDEDVREGL